MKFDNLIIIANVYLGLTFVAKDLMGHFLLIVLGVFWTVLALIELKNEEGIKRDVSSDEQERALHRRSSSRNKKRTVPKT